MNKYPYHKSEQDWKEQLDEESYRILREKGTEYPHSGAFNLHFEDGTYCVKLVKNLFLPVTISLKAIVDGQAFQKRLVEKYVMSPTILTE